MRHWQKEMKFKESNHVAAAPSESTCHQRPSRKRTPWTSSLTLSVVLGIAALFSGCNLFDKSEKAETWRIVADIPDAALFAVNGTAADDVWVVGADDGAGPVILHFNGAQWTRRDAGVRGDIWWVNAFDDGTVYFAGSDSIILRYANGGFERLKSPGLGKSIIFGIWGAASNDIYAVGSSGGRNGFLWHFDGTAWSDVPLPEDVSLDEHNDPPTLTKVWGADADDVWVVGGRGTVLRGNHRDGFRRIEADTETLLFTVHGDQASGRTVAVGAAETRLELSSTVTNTEPDSQSSTLLQGVWVAPSGVAWASGDRGVIYRSPRAGAWQRVDHGLQLNIESLHGAWVDPDGGVWSVGGNVVTSRLNAGVAIHNRAIPTIQIEPVPSPTKACPEEQLDYSADHSIARLWNEQLLNAIRRDTPRPTVHARNLFHLSAAMWDVFTAYRKPQASHYLIDVNAEEGDADTALRTAVSYAAYRVLTHRYTDAIGGEVSTACFDAFMDYLGYDPSDDSMDGDSPEAIGNRIGAAYISAFAEDGANEGDNYADPDNHDNMPPRLIVDLPGSRTDDPLLWQQIVLAEAVTQNGIPEGSGSRAYIGAHWRNVRPFALTRPDDGGPYLSLDNAPLALDETLVSNTMEVIRRTAWLDVHDETMWDVSPASRGNNPLGTDNGQGYDENPVTGDAYSPLMVKRSDFGRVLAEFWADGPDSETPPGHWNTIANLVADDPEVERRLFGEGEPLSQLAWDIHVYFALNGAVHDAAIAAWELKREHLTSRPITLIRTLGTKGQSSNPDQPSFSEDGLPLEPGLVEVITEASSMDGERHSHLKRYVGEIALWSWRGEPGDRVNEFGGHGWIRAKNWISYQRRTFVTPAFPGYISGHSTFSRAAAEVLSALTGSAFFPGGFSELTFEPGFLSFEAGPSAPVTLRWATYYDAADQAGESRIWGGIHVAPDDYDGRIAGAQVGAAAVTLAKRYFDGQIEESDR